MKKRKTYSFSFSISSGVYLQIEKNISVKTKNTKIF